MRIENVAKELLQNRQDIKKLKNQLEKEQERWEKLKAWLTEQPSTEINYFKIMDKIQEIRNEANV